MMLHSEIVEAAHRVMCVRIDGDKRDSRRTELPFQLSEARSIELGQRTFDANENDY